MRLWSALAAKGETRCSSGHTPLGLGRLIGVNSWREGQKCVQAEVSVSPAGSGRGEQGGFRWFSEPTNVKSNSCARFCQRTSFGMACELMPENTLHCVCPPLSSCLTSA